MKFSYFIFSILLIQSLFSWSQQESDSIKVADTFWKKVRFGGGLQFGVSNAYTSIGISPSAIYEFTDTFSAGVGVSYLYSKDKINDSSYNVYGISTLAIYNPFEMIQLSGEFEESYINANNIQFSNSYWVPALYMGVAYSMNKHAALGVRYDVLYKQGKSIYDSSFTPFIRVYF